jgi:hypothetical protein
VTHAFRRGQTAEDVFRAYPSIGSLAKVYGVITFVWEHPQEIEEYLRDEERAYGEFKASHPLPSEMLRAWFLRRQRQERVPPLPPAVTPLDRVSRLETMPKVPLKIDGWFTTAQPLARCRDLYWHRLETQSSGRLYFIAMSHTLEWLICAILRKASASPIFGWRRW